MPVNNFVSFVDDYTGSCFTVNFAAIGVGRIFCVSDIFLGVVGQTDNVHAAGTV